MKIVYISKARLPTEKAYGVNMVKTCEALAKAGADVTLVAPLTGNKDARQDIFSYYGIQPIFSVRQIPIVDAISMGWWRGGFWVNHLSFLAQMLARGIGEKRNTVVIARDELAAAAFSVKGYRVFYDMHGFPEKKRWFWKMIMKKMDGVIVTNRWKVEQCAAFFEIPEERIIVAPNGFDKDLFSVTYEKRALRAMFGLPLDAQIVLYAGHLYDWKGAHVLLQAASQSRFFFVFVGGTDGDVRTFKEKARGLNNVMVVGYKPHAEIPKYLKAADVLVLPNSQFSKTARFSAYSRNDTSPIKLFEYMASGVPIVASDLPSIREILNEQNATLVPPDSSDALHCGIAAVFEDVARAQQRATQAVADASGFTWDARAAIISPFILSRTRVPKHENS